MPFQRRDQNRNQNLRDRDSGKWNRTRRQQYRGRSRSYGNQGNDSTMLNDVAIVFKSDFLQTASNGNAYITYYVYRNSPDDDRGPLYRGFIFSNNRSQVARLIALMVENEMCGEEDVEDIAESDDERLFDTCSKWLSDMFSDDNQFIEIQADVFVRNQDNGYKRPFLCAPRHLTQLVERLMQAPSKKEPRKKKPIIKRVRIINRHDTRDDSEGRTRDNDNQRDSNNQENDDNNQEVEI